MPAPDHRGAGSSHGLDEPRRLRVVEDHDIISAHQWHELRSVALERVLVDLAVGCVDVPIAIKAVQVVAELLGGGKERRLAYGHEPACIDPAPADVTEQAL